MNWIKITVGLRFDVAPIRVAAEAVAAFKKKFHVEHLYYARYENETLSSFELSAMETSASWATIKAWFKGREGVTTVKIENRGTGSMAHARAYELVCALPPMDSDAKADDPFHDVIHWACNMRGLDYMREVVFYSRAIVYFSQMLSEKGSAALLALRERQITALARFRKPKKAGHGGLARKSPKSGPAAARKKRGA